MIEEIALLAELRDAEVSAARTRAEERYWRRRAALQPTPAHLAIVADYDRLREAGMGYEYPG